MKVEGGGGVGSHPFTHKFKFPSQISDGKIVIGLIFCLFSMSY